MAATPTGTVATAAASSTTVAITRLAPALGAEVRGIDLAHADGATATQLRRLLTEHLVLFFPDQHLTNEQHVALGRYFAPLERAANG